MILDEELFFDAPSSPVEDLPFFDSSSDSLQGSASDKRRSMVLKDPKKNMTEFLLRFEINKVWLCPFIIFKLYFSFCIEMITNVYVFEKCVYTLYDSFEIILTFQDFFSQSDIFPSFVLL